MVCSYVANGIPYVERYKVRLNIEDNKNIEKLEEVEYCANCFGKNPCWCGNPFYIRTWEFVYNAFKNLKMER